MMTINTSIFRLEPLINDLGLLVIDWDFKDVKPEIPRISAYELMYSFSIDNSNWSDWGTKEAIMERIRDLQIDEFYIRFKFQHKNTRPDNVGTIYQKTNVLEENYEIVINSITYDGEDIDARITNSDTLINQYPIWNFYNNQDITTRRWIEQCNAISEMYGHTCIYFKTSPLEVNSTLQHTHTREVAAVKKIMILFPNNEIGSPDKVSYSDWDIPLADDFIAHIVWEKFKLAFGDCIPDEKDYIYLPMLNKMYRLGTVQPVNKFMGKVAWFEVQLLKYEDDSSISISQSAVDELGNIPEFDSLLSDLTKGNILRVDGSDIEPEDQHEGNLIEQTGELVNDSLRTNENILHDTNIEKRHATDNYQNKLLDSTQYISLKETEKYREFFHNRLDIVQVKPDSEMFPVSMYDLSQIPHNTIALQYKTTDFSEASKNSIVPQTNFKFSFDFVLTSKFSGSMISLLTGDATIFAISTSRAIFPSLQFDASLSPQQEKLTTPPFDINEIYNFELTYENNQFVFKFYKLINKCKTLISRDILPSEMNLVPITNIHLFSGKWLTTNIYLQVDNKEIINDTSQPIRQSKLCL